MTPRSPNLESGTLNFSMSTTLIPDAAGEPIPPRIQPTPAAAGTPALWPVAERKLLVDGLTRVELLAHPILGKQYAGDYIFQAGQPPL